MQPWRVCPDRALTHDICWWAFAFAVIVAISGIIERSVPFRGLSADEKRPERHKAYRDDFSFVQKCLTLSFN